MTGSITPSNVVAQVRRQTMFSTLEIPQLLYFPTFISNLSTSTDSGRLGRSSRCTLGRCSQHRRPLGPHSDDVLSHPYREPCDAGHYGSCSSNTVIPFDYSMKLSRLPIDHALPWNMLSMEYVIRTWLTNPLLATSRWRGCLMDGFALAISLPSKSLLSTVVKYHQSWIPMRKSQLMLWSAMRNLQRLR